MDPSSHQRPPDPEALLKAEETALVTWAGRPLGKATGARVLVAVDPGPILSGVAVLDLAGYVPPDNGDPRGPAPLLLGAWGALPSRLVAAPGVLASLVQGLEDAPESGSLGLSGGTAGGFGRPAGERPVPWALVVEGVTSYGMAVAEDVWDTAAWSGRLVEAGRREGARVAGRVYRRTVKLHLGGSPGAKDATLRQALLGRYSRLGRGGGKTPTIGTKKEPGPLYGVSRHAWAALAVGVTAADRGLDRVDALAG